MSSSLDILGFVALVFVLGVGYMLWKNRKSDRLNKAITDVKNDLK